MKTQFSNFFLLVCLLFNISTSTSQNQQKSLFDYGTVNTNLEDRKVDEPLSPYAMFGDNTATITTQHQKSQDYTLKIPIVEDGVNVGLFEMDMQTGIATMKNNDGDLLARKVLSNEECARFLTIDPKAESFYSWSPYVYCKNNPLLNIDPGGDSTRVYIETQGFGHTWISVGEGEDMVIYSYEPSNSSIPFSKGLLGIKTGSRVEIYMRNKMQNTDVTSFTITDISDNQMTETMSSMIEGKGVYLDSSSETGLEVDYAIDDYNFFTNNCTTIASRALNASGSNSLNMTNYYSHPLKGVVSFSTKQEYNIPATMKRNLYNSPAVNVQEYKRPRGKAPSANYK